VVSDRITNDAREEDMEVSNMLANLRIMAVDMSNEIERQNKQLGRVNVQC